MNKSNLNFQEVILQQIEERNISYGKFSELIYSHAKLYEANKELHESNLKYQEEIETLKQEKHDISSKVHSSHPTVERNDKHSAALEQKLLKQQEELTELHRNKGARAQQIIDLNVALQEKEREVTVANQLWKEKDVKLKTITKEFLEMEQKNVDLKQANQTVNDEYQALLIAYEANDVKLRDCQVENTQLIKRLEHHERNLADAVNSANAELEREESSGSASKTSQPAGSLSPPANVTILDKISTLLFRSKKGASEEEPPRPHRFMGACSSIVRLPQEVVCKWNAHETEVTSTKFSLSGGRLATGGTDTFIYMWNFVGDKPTLHSTFRGCSKGVTSVDFDPQEQYIAASSTDLASRIWAIDSQRVKLTLTGHRSKVFCNCFLGSSQRLASGGADRTVKVWDVNSGACKQTFMAGSTCNDIVAVDSVECLASGHFDEKIRIWDPRSGSQAQSVIKVGGRITSLDMPADKSMLVCCTKNHTLELVDIRKASVPSVFGNDSFRVATDTSRCAFSPNGLYVSAGSSDGSVFTWNVKTGSLEAIAKEHSDPVISCNWTGGRLVSGDKKGISIVWTES